MTATNQPDSQAGDELLFVCKDGWAHHFVDNSQQYGNQSCSKCQDWADELVVAYAERLAMRRATEARIHESGIHIAQTYNRMLRLDRDLAEAELQRLVDRSDLPALTATKENES